MSAPVSMSRRRFCSSAIRAAAGISVFAALPACAASLNPLPVLPTRGGPEPGQSIQWLHRDGEGRVTLLLPRQEMGQGIAAGLCRIVAAELGLPPQQIDVQLPDSDDIPPVRATVGSDSMKDFALPVARAAALLREHLAAGGGAAKLVDHGQPVTLHSQMPGVLAAMPAHDPALQAIVSGARLFAADIRLDGMLHGLVLAPGMAVPEALPTGVRLVQLGDGQRGLLAERAAALHALPLTSVDKTEAMPALDIDVLQRRGSLEHRLLRDRIEDTAPWSLDRRYDVPFAAHAGIETRSAVACWHGEGSARGNTRLEVWTGSQDMFFVRDSLARHFGLARDAVKVHACRIGGGFGARTIVRAELEAALLSQAAGRPVKVQWRRQQEFVQGFHRPPSSHRIRARLDAAGRITDWWHGFASGHVIFTSAAMPRWMQAVTSFVADPGAARGALPPYAFARRRVEFSDVRLPIDTGPWRGLGAGPNGYAIEAAMDELARLAGQEPVAFRLAHLGAEQARLANCLRRAAELAGPPPVQSGSGRGVACGIYKDHAYAAVIADMAVDAGSGEARVLQVVCAQDCGPLVDADQVRAQIEGNLHWGLGMVLLEELPIEAGQVAAYTFADYPIPTVSQMPPIRIALLEPPQTKPGGAGETAMVGIAAFANGIAAAIGKPVTQLPYRPR
ncbi:molybdopterin cofactor-binding domain-containing protein [Ferrovibrio sp.]|uniref:xanthine dehydrogenase family protein molybdopterin-binding subunit n=1 Tax=Ferrovibrio sp. TaxID=1917215 RepID=UPI003D09E3E0